METAARNPYQIFASSKLPTSWESAFQANLENCPKEMRQQLEAAWKVASTQELPDRKNENWRWMDYRRLDLEALDLNTSPLNLTVNLVEASAPIPEGVIISSFHDLLKSDESLALRLATGADTSEEAVFAALPTALASDGLVIYVPEDVCVDGVVQCIINLDLENKAALTRNLIWLEPGASLDLELLWADDNPKRSGFHNGKLDVHLGRDSRLHFDERQQLGLKTWNITNETAHLDTAAQLEWNHVAVGCDTSKSFIRVNLDGTESKATLNGAMFPTDKQVVNLDTRQNHWAESTFSDLIFKSVASQEGRSVWHGMIYVDPKAQKTDAYQTNKNLVLDDSVDMKSVPGLEIHADDVKCSHGATVGRIDPEELFYLAARGIHEKEAQKLIIEGFYNQILQSFRLEKTRNELKEQLLKRMDNG